jgi:toxin-antitoxin system PIN domain toxin
MIAIDTNILVYAHRADMPFHDRARERVRSLAEGTGAWAIPWPCVHEFFAIVTNPRIFKKPTPAKRARDQLRAWLGSPTIALLAEGEGYWPLLEETLERSKVVGAKVHDARIAALCKYHGITELWTADRDYSRFAGILSRNPLAG